MTGASAGSVVEVDDVARTITITPRPGPSRRSPPAFDRPAGRSCPSKELAESLLRTGHWVAEHGLGELDRDDPTCRGHGRGPRAAPAPAARRRAGTGRTAAACRRVGARAPRRGSCAEAGRRHPADPGPAGLGQDVHRRAGDRRPGPARQAGRRGREQPQGHRQGARRGGGRGRRGPADRPVPHRPEAEGRRGRRPTRRRTVLKRQRRRRPGAAGAHDRRRRRRRVDVVTSGVRAARARRSTCSSSTRPGR